MSLRIRGLMIGLLTILMISILVYHYISLPKEFVLRITTTTSLYATGLLEKLADEFKKDSPNLVIQFIPVGSGEALKRAANGDADMVFVHAPPLEKKYIERGVLVEGIIIAYNYFVVVGPHEDPANIKGLSVTEGFKKIFKAGEEGKALFISRGDNSGTHVKEISIWKSARLKPWDKVWYIETGSGMSETLLVANEKRAYTLSDIGTYLKLKAEGRIDLEILISEEDVLINIYSVYITNPKKFPGVNYELAKAFRDFVISDRGQEIIKHYGIKEYGKPLFYPAKEKINWLKYLWEQLSKS